MFYFILVTHFLIVYYIFCLKKDRKYVLDHCTKLTEIRYIGIDADLLANISPHLALKGCLGITEEVSFEQLKAKFPNLNDVYFVDSISNEYMTKFCSDFPLLDKLEFNCENEGSDNLSRAISSLQNLRKLHLFWDVSLTEDQVDTILKNLTNLEDLDPGNSTLSHQSFLCIARMPRLRMLTITLENYDQELFYLLMNVNNFPELRYLKIEFTEDNNGDSRRDEIRKQLASYRPAVDVEFINYS